MLNKSLNGNTITWSHYERILRLRKLPIHGVTFNFQKLSSVVFVIFFNPKEGSPYHGGLEI